MGKQIILSVAGDLQVILHLMIAGSSPKPVPQSAHRCTSSRAMMNFANTSAWEERDR